MVRIRPGSTIISFHPPNASRTSAKSLHFRILSALQVDKWKTLISRFYNSDFMLPIYLWHVLYAWDEALQMLYMHIGALVRTFSPASCGVLLKAFFKSVWNGSRKSEYWKGTL